MVRPKFCNLCHTHQGKSMDHKTVEDQDHPMIYALFDILLVL